MKQLIIGVSGISAVDNPCPGVGVARSLREDRELNAKIIGLAYDVMEPGIYLDWLFDKIFMIPYPSHDKDTFIHRLRYIKKNYGLDFIIPNLDVELPLYARYIDEVAALGIKLFIPTQEHLKLRAKDRLIEVARLINITSPETHVVYTLEKLTNIIYRMGLPVMVKGIFYAAYKVNSVDEACLYFERIVEEWGYPVIVQRIVCGEEMNVVGVGDGNGGIIGQVGIKKMWLTSLGKIWNGVTIKNSAMLKASETFVSLYNWRGPFELECIVDNSDIYLIEINPRFPAWSYFAAGVGINLPANTVRMAFDLDLLHPGRDYEAGKLYIRYTYETIADMKILQNIITRGEN
ncbi:hypothetical protein OMAG_000259 [Candidatus Omnitrophus magneticus]|uniref:ATP-grasp domain-containing protein n=1 Tax=Candidatus Omnitrophus magneticus TaxID=1609969 RepID=A0A0F0CV28_9BACT|nr:hypothetical protein OMAG_000259 [Candidatus Omnitrophus magneticus]